MFAHRRGRFEIAYIVTLSSLADGSAYRCKLAWMPRVNTEDLIDTQGVAEILGLTHRNTVHQYQQRYEDMPRPVFDLGKGRVKLWLRPQIERWAAHQAARGSSRAARGARR